MNKIDKEMDRMVRETNEPQDVWKCPTQECKDCKLWNGRGCNKDLDMYNTAEEWLPDDWADNEVDRELMVNRIYRVMKDNHCDPASAAWILGYCD